MDTIIIAIRFIWAIEEMRVPIMIVGTKEEPLSVAFL